ncbi:DUF1190 domain-containing protein [Hyphomicrobium sp.]|uniref:DUF1190 domain-containing protein n=1 Tax=Hyphomicrobium sp. TaxID=82 RepID=UPI002C6023A6|nr:DUF1190 domain-containing protein [Hyphomicrobium sp.]HRN88718.1 DUF1190 domain-containing protein [Hyphomicrobium sp.]HRQ25873.1 DUF1190 domain-containing protein [Hyphomicrobium sp.]
MVEAPEPIAIGFAMRSFSVAHASLLAAAALLGGCGDSGQATGTTTSTRGVIASASDCASFGPGAVDACAQAIERAVAQHETTAAHNNLETCESAVGVGMCERAASGRYRVRLSAFLVTLSDNPRGEPLYPAPAGTVGFVTANKTTFAANDHSVAFSRLATSVAEAQAASAKGKKKSMF